MTITAALQDLIRAAIVLHNAEHPGEFLDCRDDDCTELRLDLVNLVEVEITLQATKELVPA